jgi:hypothetical protein
MDIIDIDMCHLIQKEMCQVNDGYEGILDVRVLTVDERMMLMV